MTDSFTSRCCNLNEFIDRKCYMSSWSAPSNIALAKYWGKKGAQFPANPSVSLTLSDCMTKTMVICAKRNAGSSYRTFYFNGEKNDGFGQKAFNLLDKLCADFPSFSDYDFQIFSENTFPHSSGIASSASSMASLSLCLGELLVITKTVDGFSDSDFLRHSSYYARIGSGSASRSIYGGVVTWGALPEVDDSSNDYAVSTDGINPIFMTMRDSILIVSSENKSVSSSAGHELMNQHPYKEVRYNNALKNCQSIVQLMRSGDIWSWGEVVEKEALELHGLMMNGVNSFILMKPNTLNIIEKVRNYRKKMSIPVFFTLDAGPNVHLLYPEINKDDIKKFIVSDLDNFLEDSIWFDDNVGPGPQNLLGVQRC